MHATRLCVEILQQIYFVYTDIIIIIIIICFIQQLIIVCEQYCHCYYSGSHLVSIASGWSRAFPDLVVFIQTWSSFSSPTSTVLTLSSWIARASLESLSSVSFSVVSLLHSRSSSPSLPSTAEYISTPTVVPNEAPLPPHHFFLKHHLFQPYYISCKLDLSCLQISHVEENIMLLTIASLHTFTIIWKLWGMLAFDLHGSCFAKFRKSFNQARASQTCVHHLLQFCLSPLLMLVHPGQ